MSEDIDPMSFYSLSSSLSPSPSFSLSLSLCLLKEEKRLFISEGGAVV